MLDIKQLLNYTQTCNDNVICQKNNNLELILNLTKLFKLYKQLYVKS